MRFGFEENEDENDDKNPDWADAFEQLSFPSVGATENIMIAAAAADGTTVITLECPTCGLRFQIEGFPENPQEIRETE